MKFNIRSAFSVYFLIMMLGAVACGKKNNDPQPIPDNSKVTAFNLILDSVKKGHADVEASFKDATGIAGKTATTTVTLDANNSYTGTLTLEDETKSPKAIVTNDYAVTYLVSGADVTVSGPGTTPTFTTKATGTGTLTITLTKGGKGSTLSFPLVVRQ